MRFSSLLVLHMACLFGTTAAGGVSNEKDNHSGLRRLGDKNDNGKCQHAGSSRDLEIAYEYTVRFWPRFMTYLQWQGPEIDGGEGPLPINTLSAAERPMGPEFKAIVAINVDTLYAGGTLDLTKEPVILTLPKYDYVYSIIQVDGFGTVMTNNLEPVAVGAVYALCGPDYQGSLPLGVIPVRMTVNWSLLAIRADRYFLSDDHYIDVENEADAFRLSLQLSPLSEWVTNPDGGHAILTPLSRYSTSIKTVTDLIALERPKDMMEALRYIMADPSTAPLSPNDKALIRKFNKAFEASVDAMSAKQSISSMFQLASGVRKAQSDIVHNWKSLTTWSNWVHPEHLGSWGECYLNRASGNEFIQYGNIPSTAYYAHAFVDSDSNSLLGQKEGAGYTLKFTADELPTYTRFFSVTAYTVEEVELIPNLENKYAVASYTPGLVIDADGSITIYISFLPPLDLSLWPNWLPIVGPVSVMMRVYGPLGDAQTGKYVPPPIHANENSDRLLFPPPLSVRRSEQ